MTNRTKTHDDYFDFTDIRFTDQLEANAWRLMGPDFAYYVGDGVLILPDGTWIDDDEDDQDDDE